MSERRGRALKQASAHDVAAGLKQARQSGRRPIFLIGAGCSATACVPVASQVVDYVRERYPETWKRVQSRGKAEYPDVMEALKWHTRYWLFHNLVRVASLNWAHIALALLMKHGWVGRVLTTNFDDLAMRACALFGLYPATHDLALPAELLQRREMTPEAHYKDSLLREPAVLYLHGRHNGFWQKHSEAQVEVQARMMRPVVKEAKNRPWVVVGYSGRNDPVFNTIREGGFPEGLFWVNSNPPEGEALKALLQARGRFVQQDADAFFLELLEHAMGGGRSLLSPLVSYPMGVLSALSETGSAHRLRRKVSVPSVASLSKATRARGRRLDAHWARDRREVERKIRRAERMLGDALRRSAGRVGRLTRAKREFERAAGFVGSRGEALTSWGRLLENKRLDPDAARTQWREEYQRYRRACALEPVWARALARGGTAIAWLAREAAVKRKVVDQARKLVERAIANGNESPEIHVARGDLLSASVRLRRSAGKGDGSRLRDQARRAYRKAAAIARSSGQRYPAPVPLPRAPSTR